MRKIKLFILVLIYLPVFSGNISAQATGDFGSAGTGNWGTDGTNWVIFQTASDWSDATPAGNAPTATDNVWIRNGHTVTAEATGKLCNKLTVENGGILITNSASGANNITESGGLELLDGSYYKLIGSASNLGTAWANVILANTSTLEFAGSQSSLPSTTGTLTFGNLIWSASTLSLASTTGVVTLVVNGNLTINKDATTAGKIRGCTTSYSGTVTHTVYGDLIMNNSSASNICLSLVNASASANVTFDVKGNVVLNSGKISMFESSAATTPTAALNIGGNLTIGTAAVVQFGSNSANAGTASINLKGNLINNNPTTGDGNTVGITKNSGGVGGTLSINMNGASTQNWTGLLPAAFTSVTWKMDINNPNNINLLTDGTSLKGNLNFTKGNFILGNNSLTVVSGKGTITSASSSTGYIVAEGNGVLTQTVPASTDAVFPVGTSSAYTPAKVNPTTASDFSVKMTASPSAAPTSNTLNADTWEITPATASSTVLTLTASSVASTSDYKIYHWNNTSWDQILATLSGNDYSATVSTFSPFSTGGTTITTGIANSILKNVYFDGMTIHNPDNTKLQVYDITGKKIEESNLDINMGGKAKGVYVIKGQSSVSKIRL